MNRSINFLSLGLIMALGACSVSNDGKGRVANTSNLEQTEFAKSVRGKAVFTAASDMQALFNETGIHGRIVADDALNSDKYEYTLIETISDTVAIYSVEVPTGIKYVVFKLFSYVDTNTGVKTTTIMISDLLNDLEKAQEIADSNELDKDLHVYGSLTSPADPSLVVHNPYTVMRDLIKGKKFTINGETVTVKNNGDIVYKGKELWLMSATADKATMADSRKFVGSYYEATKSSVAKFNLSIEVTDLNYNTVKDFVGKVAIKGVDGIRSEGTIAK